MRVAVIGGNGQLGSDVCRIFRHSGHDMVGLTHEHIDIVSEHSVQAALGSVDPELIVNTAAMHHVENCESDPMRAFEVNATGARNLARFSATSGAAWRTSVRITCSTDESILLTLSPIFPARKVSMEQRSLPANISFGRSHPATSLYASRRSTVCLRVVARAE